MPKMENRQETDPVVCGRCGGIGYVRWSVRYCSGCGETTVGCTCTGDRPHDLAVVPKSLGLV